MGTIKSLLMLLTEKVSEKPGDRYLLICLTQETVGVVVRMSSLLAFLGLKCKTKCFRQQ